MKRMSGNMTLHKALKAVASTKPRGRYWVFLYSVPNPDFGQYAPVAEPEITWANTFAGLRDHVAAYIEENDLGGGNCPGAII